MYHVFLIPPFSRRFLTRNAISNASNFCLKRSIISQQRTVWTWGHTDGSFGRRYREQQRLKQQKQQGLPVQPPKPQNSNSNSQPKKRKIGKWLFRSALVGTCLVGVVFGSQATVSKGGHRNPVDRAVFRTMIAIRAVHRLFRDLWLVTRIVADYKW